VISSSDIDELENLQAAHNDGRGVACVRAIITYMRRGDFGEAQAVRQADGDKTRMYADVEAVLLRIFGCRSHGNKDCSHWLCKDVVGDLDV
jgi:hypothetical protein